MYLDNFISVWLAVFISASSANLIPTPATLDPTITPAPEVPIELLRKQNDARFMGWLSYLGTWSSRKCDLGGTLYQSGDYWRCCATSLASCNVPVGCVSGSLIYTFSTGTVTKGTYACTEIYTDPTDSIYTICNTGFLYENTLDTNPETNVFCGISSLNWSYYRVKPAESTSSTPLSTPSSTIVSTTDSPTASAATGTVESPTSTPQKKKKSQAWIAGAVVGPLIGIAILVGLLIFFLKKQKKDHPPTQAPPSSYGPSYPASPQMQQNVPPGAFTPYGVAATTPKHMSWAPQSPTSHGSNTPVPPSSPYGQPNHSSPMGVGPQGQWQPVQQPSSPQLLPEHNTPHAAIQQPYGAVQHQPGWSSEYGSTKVGSTPSPQPPYAQPEYVPPGHVTR